MHAIYTDFSRACHLRSHRYSDRFVQVIRRGAEIDHRAENILIDTREIIGTSEITTVARESVRIADRNLLSMYYIEHCIRALTTNGIFSQIFSSTLESNWDQKICANPS